MDRGYRIESRNSEGNLHISLYGTFNGMCAWELFKIVRRRYSEPGRIFVGTCGLDEVKEAGADMFKSGMKTVKTRKDWLYFKGKKGFEIAPDGSRVLLCEKQGERRRPCSRKLPGLVLVNTVDMLEDKIGDLGGKLVIEGLKIDGDPGDSKDEILEWAESVAKEIQ